MQPNFFLKESLIFLLVIGVTTPLTAKPADKEKTGLKVGTPAPQFTLKDQNDKERTLKEFLNKGNKVALVFYRSAGW